MLIQNVTFMVEPRNSGEFEAWIRHELGDAMGRLSVMREVGGAPASADEAASYAYQEEFDTIEAARERYETVIEPLTESFLRRFAPHAIFFTSIFETI